MQLQAGNSKGTFPGWLRTHGRTVVVGLPEIPLDNTEWEFQLALGHCIVEILIPHQQGRAVR